MRNKTLKILTLLFFPAFIFLGYTFLKEDQSHQMQDVKNVFGNPIALCCNQPKTGFYRNGICQTGAEDFGTHIVCAQVTDEFLKYSRTCGNDLITANPKYNFPGLQHGDFWCLCISRWIEAHNAGVAPKINLHATHIKVLDYVDMEVLKRYELK